MKKTFILTIQTDDQKVIGKYPNYHWNYSSIDEFIDMLKASVTGISSNEYGFTLKADEEGIHSTIAHIPLPIQEFLEERGYDYKQIADVYGWFIDYQTGGENIDAIVDTFITFFESENVGDIIEP
jgi:hypothetical protein